MARLGKNDTLVLFKEAKRLLQRCVIRADKVGGFSKELESRITKARIACLEELIKTDQTSQSFRRAVIRMLEYAVKDTQDDVELCRLLVELHNKLYPEMNWTGEW